MLPPSIPVVLWTQATVHGHAAWTRHNSGELHSGRWWGKPCPPDMAVLPIFAGVGSQDKLHLTLSAPSLAELQYSPPSGSTGNECCSQSHHTISVITQHDNNSDSKTHGTILLFCPYHTGSMAKPHTHPWDAHQYTFTMDFTQLQWSSG
jgi:hypothetical protein